MFKLISNNKVLIFSLSSLVVAFVIATNSSEVWTNGFDNKPDLIHTKWGLVCMSAIFTVAGVTGIGYWLLRSKDKSDK